MTLKDLLRDAFRTGITMKGVDGVLEAAGGVLLWFVKPSALSHALRILSFHELSRDPNDFVGIHLLHISERVARSDPTFASIYLLWHGLAKAGLSVALWLNKMWSYPLAIAAFSVFAAYQTYRFSHTHSIALIILTFFDVGIIWLIWKEYRVEGAAKSGETKG
ncbi:MAG TPA: DUF2127 domain-containing protein [Verrucomicrobiae bacterium]|nr:DUF2127 domain-containing protein [Verrucomicrobiae bacterium]